MNSSAQTIFIFSYEKTLHASELQELSSRISTLLSTWNTHGKQLSSAIKWEENQFLIITEPEGLSSGCSKDKLNRGLMDINTSLGLNFAPPGKFFVRKDREILLLNRKELSEKFISNEISGDNLLFPCWLSTLAELENQWGKLLKKFPSILPKTDLV
jgi:hypothetical protein